MNREENQNNGVIQAILDLYEKALLELKATINELSNEQLTTIVDLETKDEDCRSIQTILSHVVQSGYTYVIAIRKAQGEAINYRNKVRLENVAAYKIALDELFKFNEQLFADYPAIQWEEYDVNKKMVMRWGQVYDVEQLFEHAILHIMRHNRQIEGFKTKLNDSL